MTINETSSSTKTIWTDHHGVTTFLETIAYKIRDAKGNERMELSQSVRTHDPRKSGSLCGKITLLSALGGAAFLTGVIARCFFYELK